MKIYCDYDSTLTDVTLWEFYNVLHHDKSNKIKPYSWFANELPYTWEKYSTRPLEGSKEFFNELTELYDTYILTSTKNKEHQKGKNEHIKYYFNTNTIIHEVYKHKYAICPVNKTPNILIDDSLSNCLMFAANGGYSIVYNHEDQYEYNRLYRKMDGVYVANTYDEVLEIVKEITNG